MARRYSLFISNLIIVGFMAAASLASAPPSLAADEECFGQVVSLPSPLRKWAQFGCTQYGQTLGSREGWVWASLKDSGNIAIVAGSAPRSPHDAGIPSFFSAIQVDELREQELALALATFHQDMQFNAADPRVYRVELTVATGGTVRVYFFDFGTFAGGMWCPEDGCVPESRFLIMKREPKDQLTASNSSAIAAGGKHHAVA